MIERLNHQSLDIRLQGIDSLFHGVVHIVGWAICRQGTLIVTFHISCLHDRNSSKTLCSRLVCVCRVLQVMCCLLSLRFAHRIKQFILHPTFGCAVAQRYRVSSHLALVRCPCYIGTIWLPGGFWKFSWEQWQNVFDECLSCSPTVLRHYRGACQTWVRFWGYTDTCETKFWCILQARNKKCGAPSDTEPSLKNVSKCEFIWCVWN